MYISIHPSMHPSIRPFVRPSTPLSIHDSHANALSCQIIQTALNEVDIRWDIWWIFVCIPTQQRIFWSRRSNICCEVGVCLCWSGQSAGSVDSLPVGCKRACQTTSVTKKQATSTCSANLSHTKLMLSLEIPWNFKCNSSISAFGKHGKILLISGLMRQCLRKRDHSPRLKSPEQELTELTQLTPWHGTCGTGPGSA